MKEEEEEEGEFIVCNCKKIDSEESRGESPRT